MLPEMIASFELKLQNIQSSVQELEGVLSSMKEYAKQQEINKEIGSGNDTDAPTASNDTPLQPADLGIEAETSTAANDTTQPSADLPLRVKNEITTESASSSNDETGQRIVKSEPEDVEPEGAEQPIQDKEPEIDRVQGLKRKADDSSDAPNSKRALFEEPESHDEFAIFNYRERLDELSPESVVRSLSLLGAPGLFVPSDIEMLDRRSSGVFRSCEVIAEGRDMHCVLFRVRGPMADHLRNWVNGPTYVEESHLENAKRFTTPDCYSYLLNSTRVPPIVMFSLLSLTAQEIRESLRIDVRMAPEHVELWDEKGNRRVLTFTELISDQWVSLTRKAFSKMSRNGKRTINYTLLKHHGLPRTHLNEVQVPVLQTSQ